MTEKKRKTAKRYSITFFSFQEERGGRHDRKLGFADINLAEYAGSGPTTQRYILQPYNQSHRLDNSIVRITVNVTLKEGDTIFQRYRILNGQKVLFSN